MGIYNHPLQFLITFLYIVFYCMIFYLAVARPFRPFSIDSALLAEKYVEIIPNYVRINIGQFDKVVK